MPIERVRSICIMKLKVTRRPQVVLSEALELIGEFDASQGQFRKKRSPLAPEAADVLFTCPEVA